MKTGNGIGFLGVLFIVFLVLKLTNQIDWSWWLITCPLWASVVVVAVVWLVLMIWSRLFLWYKLRTDDTFKKQYELLKRQQEEIRKQPRTFADRMKQMQEQREKLERERNGKKS